MANGRYYNKSSAVAEMGDRTRAKWPESGERGCCVDRDLPPYQVASWPIQPFRHNRHGPRFTHACLRP